MRRQWISLLTLAVLVTCQVAIAGNNSTPIGKQISEFTLRDYRGKVTKLSDFKESKLLVVAILGTDCPLVRLYGPRLEEISKQYASKGVVIIGINSNRQDQPTKIGAHARKYGMTFPILKDPDSSIADHFGALRTPEMFVLDENRVVRYWGRVDDQFGFTTGVGYGRQKMTRNDLTIAIDELLAGKEVSVAVTRAPGCKIGRVAKRTEAHGDVTYSNQIARIFKKRCVECHREKEIAPFPMANYEDVLGWGEMIREVIDQGRMPPWYADAAHGVFANDTRMTDEEINLVARWVENGQPEGDPKDLPEPPEYAEGWTIPEPDEIYPMDKKAFTVPATGVVEYQYYTVDPGFTEDKWVKAVQSRPGNRAVVHHIIVFLQKPTERGDFRQGGALIGYAPGMQARQYPDGYAIRIPAGSKFVFQLHYTPIGTEEQDLSSVGFVYADPDTIEHEIQGGVCGTQDFVIPAGANEHAVVAEQHLVRDTTLLSMMPHLHLRGIAFKYEVTYPDGRNEILLDVPKYDFNWQLWYDFAEPKLLPKGSVIKCTALFDNSEDNVYNPDPTVDVVYGEQTWDEMMFGWYSTSVAKGAIETPQLLEEDRQERRRQRRARRAKRFKR